MLRVEQDVALLGVRHLFLEPINRRGVPSIEGQLLSVVVYFHDAIVNLAEVVETHFGQHFLN